MLKSKYALEYSRARQYHNTPETPAVQSTYLSNFSSCPLLSNIVLTRQDNTLSNNINLFHHKFRMFPRAMGPLGWVSRVGAKTYVLI